MRLLLEQLRAGGQNEPSKVDESESSKNPHSCFAQEAFQRKQRKQRALELGFSSERVKNDSVDQREILSSQPIFSNNEDGIDCRPVITFFNSLGRRTHGELFSRLSNIGQKFSRIAHYVEQAILETRVSAIGYRTIIFLSLTNKRQCVG